MVDLSQLDDPRAMHAALAEAVGPERDEFISRYPTFGTSLKYVVIHHGQRIDSKRLISAAYAKQFPKRSALTRHDFKGGGDTKTVLNRFNVPWIDLSQGDGSSDSWGTKVGSISTKNEIARRYGGSTQGGILASRSTPNIMLYSDPSVGKKNGYPHDGWSRGGSTFMYTGEGRIGPQTLTNGNKSILNHQKDRRSLRLFVSAGYREGTRTVLRQYLGEFRVDDQMPYIIDESLDVEGNQRTVYVFRLRPAGPSLHKTADVTPDYTAGEADAGAARIVDLDSHLTRSFNTPGIEPSVAQKREQKLVEAFINVLEDRGHTPKAFRIPLPYNNRGLKTDIFDVTSGTLYEAKATANRSDVRLALGQILDYRRYLSGKFKNLAVLLPAEPADDMIDLLASFSIDVVWRINQGRDFMRASGRVRNKF